MDTQWVVTAAHCVLVFWKSNILKRALYSEKYQCNQNLSFRRRRGLPFRSDLESLTELTQENQGNCGNLVGSGELNIVLFKGFLRLSQLFRGIPGCDH